MSAHRLVLRLVSAVLLALCVAPPAACADEVVSPDGTRYMGKVLVRGEDGAVTLQLASGATRTFSPAGTKEVVLDAAPAGEYVRFHVYRPGWSRLEVLCRTFRSADGEKTVMLAGAVHIADLLYYRRLQRILDAHDVVLYEGVGARDPGDLSTFEPLPEGERRLELARPFTHAPARTSDASELDYLTRLQLGMGRSLGLAFQRDGIDYSHSWWVPADVSVSELRRLFDERETSIFSDLFAGGGTAQQQAVNAALGTALGELGASIFTGKPTEIIWKETFAKLLAGQMSEVAAAPGEADRAPATVMQEVLIVGRNKVVMEKIGQIVEAPQVRSVAVFYGAGHNADLERRMRELGFRAVRDEWVPAWEIHYAPPQGMFGREPAPAAPRREPKLY